MYYARETLGTLKHRLENRTEMWERRARNIEEELLRSGERRRRQFVQQSNRTKKRFTKVSKQIFLSEMKWKSKVSQFCKIVDVSMWFTAVADPRHRSYRNRLFAVIIAANQVIVVSLSSFQPRGANYLLVKNTMHSVWERSFDPEKVIICSPFSIISFFLQLSISLTIRNYL